MAPATRGGKARWPEMSSFQEVTMSRTRSESAVKPPERFQLRGSHKISQLLSLTGLVGLAICATPAQAVVTCSRTITADVVALDTPIMFNRLGG